MSNHPRELQMPLDFLDIRDLLDSDCAEHFGDYVVFSVSSDGRNTAISVTTTSTEPETVTAVLPGVAAPTLQMLLNENSIDNP